VAAASHLGADDTGAVLALLEDDGIHRLPKVNPEVEAPAWPTDAGACPVSMSPPEYLFHSARTEGGASLPSLTLRPNDRKKSMALRIYFSLLTHMLGDARSGAIQTRPTVGRCASRVSSTALNRIDVRKLRKYYLVR
jgi:hypothetical protein